MNVPSRVSLRNQLELLDAIRARPRMYLRDGSVECMQGVRDIENIMYGYELRGDPIKECQFTLEFNSYLQNTYPDIYHAPLGMYSVIDKKCTYDDVRSPWDTFFELVADFRVAVMTAHDM